MFRAEELGASAAGLGERGSRGTPPHRQRQGQSMGGQEEVRKVPGQASLIPCGQDGATEAVAGLSFSGCQSGLGSRDWFPGSSPGSQPLLAALFGESAGISGAAPTPPPGSQLLALSSLKVAKAAVL